MKKMTLGEAGQSLPANIMRLAEICLIAKIAKDIKNEKREDNIMYQLFYEDNIGVPHVFNAKKETIKSLIKDYGSIEKYLDSLGVSYKKCWIEKGGKHVRSDKL